MMGPSSSSQDSAGKIQTPRVGFDTDDEEVTGPIVKASSALDEGIPGADRALLMVLVGFDAGLVVAMEGNEVTIGRDKTAQFSLDDPGISRAHCRVTRTPDGKYFVEDLNSRNGTLVNGQLLRGRTPIASGQRIQVGPNIVLRFWLTDRLEERLVRQLYYASTRDHLTLAYNRRYFLERLRTELAFATRHGSMLGLLVVDIDQFSLANERYGQLIGDEILRQLTSQAMGLIRREDLFARIGGEEFAVLVRGIPHANVILLAERIRRSVETMELLHKDVPMKITVSIGVASYSGETAGHQPATEALLDLASHRLRAAKKGGRNCVVGHPEASTVA